VVGARENYSKKDESNQKKKCGRMSIKETIRPDKRNRPSDSGNHFMLKKSLARANAKRRTWVVTGPSVKRLFARARLTETKAEGKGRRQRPQTGTKSACVMKIFQEKAFQETRGMPAKRVSKGERHRRPLRIQKSTHAPPKVFPLTERLRRSKGENFRTLGKTAR